MSGSKQNREALFHEKCPAKSKVHVAIVGSGPAGLMAAFTAAERGLEVHLFEKRKSAGRKLLVAGSSGLNITFDAPVAEFATFYGESASRIRPALEAFSPEHWRDWIENLGIATFKGTSRRWFVEGMKASELLRAWTQKLQALGVIFHFGYEWTSFRSLGREGVELEFKKANANGEGAEIEKIRFQAALLALGGGSWEPSEKPLRWVNGIKNAGIRFADFKASNVGFQVAWSEAFLQEADGYPIKNIVLRSSRGQRSGDLVVTRYGLEGTPVYAVGEVGTVVIDLKPDLTQGRVLSLLRSGKENLSPMRRVKRYLNLCEGALALVFHFSSREDFSNLDALAARIKAFPLNLLGKQPLDEAISSSGGVAWDELDENLMLRRFPGIFLAGEMIDWDAPTGGFLIQACVSQGRWVGEKMGRLRD